MSAIGVSANKLEILQIANAVAAEKQIDKTIVLDAMEEAIQKAVRMALREHSVRIMDLFVEWDVDGDGTVSKQEFRRAMSALGINATASIIKIPLIQGVMLNKRKNFL